MKILIVTDRMHIGGAETHILTLIENLASRGITVTLLSGGGVFAERLKECGIRCVSAPFYKRDPISVGACIIALRREMRDADVVHTHTRFTSTLAARIRGAANVPPIVTTAHLNFPTFPYGPVTFLGDKTLAVSEDVREHLIAKYSVSPSRITVTRNSIDPRLFSGERSVRRLIVHTSRIDRGRARCAFTLVGAAEELLKEFPEHRILIIGDGDRHRQLSAAAEAVNERLGSRRIILAGACSDVPSLLKYAEVFVGVSRAALEAMAYGIPSVIAGDEGYGGIACEDNFDELARTNFCARGNELLEQGRLTADIRRLLESPSFSKRISRYCRLRVNTDYAPNIMTNDAIEVYKSVLTPPRVCLIGYFGYGNLGDEESLGQAVLLLHRLGIKEICVPVRDANGSTYKDVSVYDRMNPYDLAEAIHRSDALILTGGNLLQNETSKRSLLYYTSLIRHAKSAGKRIYAISSGIGPIEGAASLRSVSECLSYFRCMGLRTEGDLHHVKRLSGRTDAFIMPDLCFLMKQGKMSKNPTRFGIIVSHDTKFRPSDLYAIAACRSLMPEIISLFPARDNPSVGELAAMGIPIRTPSSYAELSEILDVCAFTVTERLHGAIFSVISHTPTYIRCADGKTGNLLEELGKRARRTGSFPVIHPFDLASVRAKKEVGVTDSDFHNIIKDLCDDIEEAAIKMLGSLNTI